MANPTLLKMPIARDGNKNTIPATDNGTTGRLSQQYGWQLINAIPPQQGGKAVKREDFNGALFLLSNLLFHLQKGWQFEWDSNQTYYAGCIVKDTSDGKMYMCLNDVTSTTAPHSDTTNWKMWDLSMLSNYLPLGGGTMTGNIKGNTADWWTIQRSETNGAYISMGNLSSTSTGIRGAIVLVSGGIDGKYRSIALDPEDGFLYKNSMSENRYDLGNSAIVAKSLASNGYVKRLSGEITQWGSFTLPANTTQYSGSLPISFSDRFSARIVGNIFPAYTTALVRPLNICLADKSSYSAQINSALPESVYVSWIATGY